MTLMTELAQTVVQAYNAKDFSSCKASLFSLALSCNSNISEEETYNHSLKHLLFAVNFIRNPLGSKYTSADHDNIQSILLDTLHILEAINDPSIDTSDVFQKALVIDNRIIDDFVDLIMYTYVFNQMNQINSKRMDNCETLKLPFVEQVLTILTFIQDQTRILRQNLSTYLHDDYITGMEFSVANLPVEYYDDLTSSIADTLESDLEAANEIIRYLYFQHRDNFQSEVQNRAINCGLICPYENTDFQRYMYIAAQRHLLHRIEEGIRYGYYTYKATGTLDNGVRCFQFSLENDDKYRARKLGIFRRDYQYQRHAMVNSMNQADLAEAHQHLHRIAALLIKAQTEDDALLNLSQFHPDIALFQKIAQITSPKLQLVEQLTKEYYLECQVDGVNIRDFLCAYQYLSTLAEIVFAASLQLIDQDIPSSYVKEICLVNTSYLSSELARIYNYESKYAAKLIDRFVFHEKDNRYDDIFSQPLPKISNTQVVLCQALLEQVNLDRAIERQFIRFNKNVSEVGRAFEKDFIDTLSRGYSQGIIGLQHNKIPNFKLNTNKINFVAFDGKDIEFDMIAMLGDYIILTELKAVMSSYSLDDLEGRKKNVKNAIEQLHRRAESLKYDWDTIRSMVSIDLPEERIDEDHIVLVVCTDSYDYTPLREGNVFITDESTYLKYFTEPYVHIVKTDKKTLDIITVKELWAKGHPDAEEFMAYLLDPVTIHPLSNCITKKDIPGLVVDEQDFLLIYEDYILTQDPIRSTTTAVIGN